MDRYTTYIDTSLSIQREYSHNYLRKDTFGLLAFANDGQTYNTLQYSLNDFSPFPEFRFKAKHFNFLEANQVRYSSVAIPANLPLTSTKFALPIPQDELNANPSIQ